MKQILWLVVPTLVVSCQSSPSGNLYSETCEGSDCNGNVQSMRSQARTPSSDTEETTDLPTVAPETPSETRTSTKTQGGSSQGDLTTTPSRVVSTGGTLTKTNPSNGTPKPISTSTSGDKAPTQGTNSASNSCESGKGVCLPKLGRTKDDKIMDINQREVTFRGINWNGFEANRYLDHKSGASYEANDIMLGMYDPYAQYPHIVKDVIGNILRIKMLGFNAVRLPFSFDRMEASFTKNGRDFIRTSNNIKKYHDNGYQKETHIPNGNSLYDCQGAFPKPSVFQTHLTPGSPITGSGWLSGKDASTFFERTFAAFGQRPDYTSNKCNHYLSGMQSGGSYIDRFISVVDQFVHHGFYVIIDEHINVVPGSYFLKDLADSVDYSGTQKTHTESKAIELYADIWKRFFDRLTDASPDMEGRVMVDIVNEGDCHSVLSQGKTGEWNGDINKLCGTSRKAPRYNPGFRWDTDKASNRFGIGDVYRKVIELIAPNHPNTLFLVEGTGQPYSSHCWGDGFATDAATLNRSAEMNGGVRDSSPARFFDWLVTKENFARQVIISPHLYSFSVTGDENEPKGREKGNPELMIARLNKSLGYLNKIGYKGVKFPIVVGEFGLEFPVEHKDKEQLATFVEYFNQGDSSHNPIKHWFWWTWPHDSGDTGGMLVKVPESRKSIDIRWEKIEFLMCYKGHPGLGLRPWFIKDAQFGECTPYNNAPLGTR